MSKVLVTGGAGFIGSTLAIKLIEEGHDVVVIDDLSSGLREYLSDDIKFYELDIRSDEVEEVFKTENFEYVFHMAAQIDLRKSVEDPVLDNSINVLGGLNILENSRKYNIKKFIYASTGGAVYGDTEVIPTTENFPPNPVSPYGIHKFTFEKYLNYYRQVFGIDYITLRMANVYGPRQFKGGEAGVVTLFVDNAVNKKKSKVNGDGKQTRDYVYVDDVVDAFILAMDSDYIGELNVATGIETNLHEIITAIEKATGAKFDFDYVDAKKGEQRRSCLSNDKINKILNWSPKVKFREGVIKTIEWSKNK